MTARVSRILWCCPCLIDHIVLARFATSDEKLLQSISTERMDTEKLERNPSAKSESISDLQLLKLLTDWIAELKEVKFLSETDQKKRVCLERIKQIASEMTL